MASDIRYLKFNNMSSSVEFEDCGELIDCLLKGFVNWSIDTVQSNNSPVITVKQENNKYHIKGHWVKEPMLRTGKVNAICGFTAELIRAYVKEDARLLCLHGAAAELGGKLVVFPSKYRAGKSIISACLAANGIKLFGDDVLPVDLDDGFGVAPGLAPRLRLPLPENLSQHSRDFIDSNKGLEGDSYLYLDLGKNLLAAKDHRAPIGAFVLLEREAGVTPVFEEISEADVLSQVVWQNFARQAEAPQILEILSMVVAGSQSYRLRYDRAEDAVKLLIDEFSCWPGQIDSHTIRKASSISNVLSAIELPAGSYVRNAGISVITIDEQSFLADAQGAAIHQLNIIGSAIWTLLEEPMHIGDMVDLIQAAFPDTTTASIENDVTALVDQLVTKKLLVAGNNKGNASKLEEFPSRQTCAEIY
ncbi:MAG: PqqD family peptide modification chaperone [Gammaproteobacteria bacterium]|nr:PqqD family peptide modification chaperone [Gammaproteobacteria bacterium]